jgi:hypothetical protein
MASDEIQFCFLYYESLLEPPIHGYEIRHTFSKTLKLYLTLFFVCKKIFILLILIIILDRLFLTL